MHRGCSGIVEPSSLPPVFLAKPCRASSCCWPGLLCGFYSFGRLHSTHTYTRTDLFNKSIDTMPINNYLKISLYILLTLHKFVRMVVFYGVRMVGWMHEQSVKKTTKKTTTISYLPNSIRWQPAIRLHHFNFSSNHDRKRAAQNQFASMDQSQKAIQVKSLETLRLQNSVLVSLFTYVLCLSNNLLLSTTRSWREVWTQGSLQPRRGLQATKGFGLHFAGGAASP